MDNLVYLFLVGERNFIATLVRNIQWSNILHIIYKSKKCFVAEIINVLVVAGVLLISGCQSGELQEPDHVVQKVAPAPSQAVSLPAPQATPSAAEEPSAGEGSATVCQRELAALAKISSSAYAAKKAAFETLLRNASTYSAVRGDINAQTRDTLDALYKYKTQKLCNDIEQAIQQGLISRGESVR